MEDNAARDAVVSSIQRNYAIALVAKSIRAAAGASNEKNNEKAASVIKQGIQKAKTITSKSDDKHLGRVIKIAMDYQENLQ